MSEPEPGDPVDPLAELLRALGGGGGQVPDLQSLFAAMGAPGAGLDPAMLAGLLGQMQAMLAGSGDGPVNWTVAHDVARATASAADPSAPVPVGQLAPTRAPMGFSVPQGTDPSVGAVAEREVSEALRTADLWLDRVVDLPSVTARTFAWSRAQWVESTLPVWKGVIEPVAARVSEAMTQVMTTQAPEELRGVMASALPMLRSMGGAFFGAQAGQALGQLAHEVVGGHDTGLPLLPAGQAALLPVNVAALGEGLELPIDEVRLYLALREAAAARLFTSATWLRGHLLAAVEAYARGIRIDVEHLEEAVRDLDPTDLDGLRESLASGLFETRTTPEQDAALARLETVLALVEGWIDEVVHAAASGSLPHADQLREVIRRRRAAGGPAEHTFATLVGLQLRPRRLREAAQVWAAIGAARGVPGRDALWAHPDLVPGAEAFADPDAYAASLQEAGEADAAMDAALDALLSQAREEGGDADPEPREEPGRD
ncbi:MAG: zinc-dependent metalloprotease [Kineosporiaceae bacterium]